MSTLSVGQSVVFKGYSSLEEGQEVILVAGETCEVVEVFNDEGGVSYGLKASDNSGRADSAFPEEVEAAAAPAARASGRKAAKEATAAPAPEAPKVKGAKAAKTEAPKVKAEKPAKVKAEKPAKVKAEKLPKAPKAPKEPKVKAEIVIHDSPEVAEMVRSGNTLLIAKQLIENMEQSAFSLGGVLLHIQVSRKHEDLGFAGKEGFWDYVKMELGLEQRKARYLISIYTTFSSLGVDASKLAEIGWSKAKALLNVATKENFDGLIAYAKEHTRQELEDYVRTEHVKVRGQENPAKTVKRVTYKFSVFEDQSEVVRSSIEKAKVSHGVTDDNDALTAIIIEWASMLGDVDVPIETALANLSARYGKKIQVVE